MTAAIIGLGLMGGSLAMAIKKLPMIKSIIGFDHNKEHEQEALKLKLVNKIVDFNEIKQADIIWHYLNFIAYIRILNIFFCLEIRCLYLHHLLRIWLKATSIH